MSEPETPRPSFPFWDYTDLCLFIGAILPALFAATLIARGLFVGFALRGRGQTPELLAAQFLGYGFWFAFLYLLLKVKYQRPFWESLGWVRFGESFWRRIGAGVALAFAAGILGALLRTPDLDMPIKRLLTNRLSVLLVGLAAITFGPVCEELAFRGFLQPLLVRSLRAAPGIVLSALPFALLHGPQYAWSWRHVLVITIAGSFFGWMRHRTGSTAAAAVMHAAYNFTSFSAFVLFGKDLPAQW
jgi:CAAX protease family protein